MALSCSHCDRNCTLEEGQAGNCGKRVNVGGTIIKTKNMPTSTPAPAPQSTLQLPDATTEQPAHELAAPATAEARAELPAAPETAEPQLTGDAAKASLAARKALLKAGAVDGGRETTPPAHPELKDLSKPEANEATALQTSTADAVHQAVPESVDHSSDAAESPAPQSAGGGWLKRAFASFKRFFTQGGQTAASMVRGPKKAE